MLSVKNCNDSFRCKRLNPELLSGWSFKVANIFAWTEIFEILLSYRPSFCVAILYFLINMLAFHLYIQDPDKGTQLHLGINHCGILTFQDSRKIQHFRWSEVQKINFEGKMFIVHVTINEVSKFAYCQSGWFDERRAMHARAIKTG